MRSARIMRHTTFVSLAVLLLAVVAAPVLSVAAESSPLDELIASGNLEAAADHARAVVGKADPATDWTLPLARLARAFQQVGEPKAAAEFYQRAVVASQQPAATSLTPGKLVVIQLAAASALTQTGNLADATDAVTMILADTSAASDPQRQWAVATCLQLGAAALSSGDLTTASAAYNLAVTHAGEPDQATARLGAAWAAAVTQTKPSEAAERLADFVRRYPDHTDASRAARACAECLKQAGREHDAQLMLADLLQRWPDSQAAWEIVRSQSRLSVGEVPSTVRTWILDRAGTGDLDRFDAETTVLGMLIAGDENDLAAAANLARHLVSIDDSGQSTSDVLAAWARQDKPGEAERFAATLIASDHETNVTPAAREAACRWAGRHEHWSLLALASETENPEQSSSNRTVAVERLFAESLMQLGRTVEASRWWNHLVDSRKVTDFATLLRCAEAETCVGDDASLAEQRIGLARAAAGENRFQVTLVDMLAAELAVRRSKFDDARALLENIIRSSETEAGLRGRAQWLIGETHYLQHHFSEAIESYRRVEGIDPGGQWVSPSLLQAGKAFEQLGRTREAAVCYGNLVGRFADSPHAQMARQRLAAIDPNLNNSIPSIRR